MHEPNQAAEHPTEEKDYADGEGQDEGVEGPWDPVDHLGPLG